MAEQVQVGMVVQGGNETWVRTPAKGQQKDPVMRRLACGRGAYDNGDLVLYSYDDDDPGRPARPIDTRGVVVVGRPRAAALAKGLVLLAQFGDDSEGCGRDDCGEECDCRGPSFRDLEDMQLALRASPEALATTEVA